MQINKPLNLLALAVLLISLVASSQLEATGVQAEANEPAYIFRRTWGGDGNHLLRPVDVDIGMDGRIYVLSGDFVVIIQPGERIFTRFGGKGSGEGQFKNPGGIALDGLGNVYVADTHKMTGFKNSRPMGVTLLVGDMGQRGGTA